MKIYTGQNVYDAALDRIRWLFDEFEDIYVDFSGGKDSTVVFYLCLQVAQEKGRLPLRVLFVDQEAEWMAVIDYIRTVMHRPDVAPYWLQVPIRLSSAASQKQKWLDCWAADKEDQWIRPKEPDSIHENVFGTISFIKMFSRFLEYYHPDSKACQFGGIRTQESPSRYLGLTTYPTYHGRTWGKADNKDLCHVTMYPIYDWGYTDVWKAIHDNGWPYCSIYDAMYQYGLPLMKMRVSAIHHETAVNTLMYVHELEAETWERVQARLMGVNAAKQLQSQFLAPKELPWMFSDWKEYRDYLLEKMFPKGTRKETLRKMFADNDQLYSGPVLEKWYKTGVLMVLTNDYFDTRRGSFGAANIGNSKNKGRISGRTE